MRERMRNLPEWKRRAMGKRVLGHVSEAYGRMILGTGLFQADGELRGLQGQALPRLTLLPVAVV